MLCCPHQPGCNLASAGGVCPRRQCFKYEPGNLQNDVFSKEESHGDGGGQLESAEKAMCVMHAWDTSTREVEAGRLLQV